MTMSFILEVGELSTDVKELAERELNETPENARKALEELKEYLRNDATLNASTNDDFLTVFLRPCKFYAKSAYELMKRFAEFKEKYQNLVGDLMPENMKEQFVNSNVINVLKNRDHKRRRVLIQQFGSKWDPSKLSAEDMFKMLFLIQEAATVEPETQIRGGVIILDFSGITSKQIFAFTPTMCERLITFVQTNMPLRLKEVHVVNQPLSFQIILNILNPYIKEKLRSRMHIHGNEMSSLHKFLEPSHLPKDYGGDLPEIDYSTADWYSIFDTHFEYMKNMNECGFTKK